MCIFCGGACGGAGDALLSLAAVGAPMAVLRIQSRLAAHRRNTEEDAEAENECAPGVVKDCTDHSNFGARV